jgi:NADPH:quinone reductase
MKAIYIEQHGAIADLKASERPQPAIKPGEALVRIQAAGINPSDIAGVQGRFPHAVLPRIVGRDFAGVVAEGPAEMIGAEVWGSGGDLGIDRDGTHAEYLALPKEAVVRRPRNVTVEEASALGVPFVAAYSALVELGRFKEGQWVIISGAAGAVGQAAIQLAHASRGRVIALIKDAGEQWVANLPGVEAVAESDKGNLEAVVRQVTSGRGADLALNGVGGAVFGPIMSSLAVGGRHVLYSAAGGREFPLDILQFYRNEFTLLGLDTQKLSAARCAAILNDLVPMFESGALKAPAVNERYPLTDAAKAYGRTAADAGKVVFTMAANG